MKSRKGTHRAAKVAKFRARRKEIHGVRKFYEAVTNDATGQEPFWSTFKEHNDRRVKVVHRGEKAMRADGDASIAVVEEVITHIQQHYAATWQGP